ncbi:biotin transporter BioY [Clostridium sp.]|uniref:biotin transporter BioY n=1 Tax=Clostridium sp. TaxID=1506 RepID=UPI003216A7B7
MKIKTKEIIFCALFAALTAILSQISIPLPFTPVPINLATVSVCLGAGLLGSRLGAISQVVYVIIGAIGVPVFANFTAGLGTVVGPTGGYIIGYIVATILIGVIIKRFGENLHTYMVAMGIGILGCYTIGTAWFMYITKTGLFEALIMCVVPFLIGDMLKVVLSAFLVKRLKRFI